VQAQLLVEQFERQQVFACSFIAATGETVAEAIAEAEVATIAVARSVLSIFMHNPINKGEKCGVMIRLSNISG